MRVWIAEKSSFGRDLSSVLGNPVKVNGLRSCWDTDGGRVVCASGHLVSLAEPEDYDEKYADWKVEDLPIIPSEWKLKVIPDKQSYFDSIEKALHGATEIVIATDAGREGEYIAYLIITMIGINTDTMPMKRLWSSGANAASIKKAVDNLLPYSEKFMLAQAAQIRAESDWIEGMNLTRLFTVRFRKDDHHQPISIGRVQTAALAVIVQRSDEIQAFKPQTYYEIEVPITASGHIVRLSHRPAETDRIYESSRALAILHAVRSGQAPVMVTSEDRTERPPRIFESSSLQIRAYNLWGWEAQRTETITQKLYDERKLITYPRTDGIYLEDEQWDDVPAILANIAATKGMSNVPVKDLERFKEMSLHVPDDPERRDDVFSSKKLEQSGADHHGIIPTTVQADLEILDDDEKKLYLLVVRQYLAQLLPDCKYRQQRMEWTHSDIPFSATGRTIISQGWKVLFGAEDETAEKAEKEEEQPIDIAKLPPILNGTMGMAGNGNIQQNTTRAPKVFTEGSIIAAMKDLGTVSKDPAIRDRLKGWASIGTKSTWGETVKKLKERRYISSVKGQLKPTVLGKALVYKLREHIPDLINIEKTAMLEKMLGEVEASKISTDVARNVLWQRNEQAIILGLNMPDDKLPTPEGGSYVKDGKKRPFIEPAGGSWPLNIIHDDVTSREAAKAMGAKFNGDTKKWHMPKTCSTEADLRTRRWIA